MRRYLLIVTILLFSGLTHAQVSIGLRAGYGAHGLYTWPSSMEKYQVPYFLSNGGLQIIYNNENNAGVQMEFNYANKGWKEQDSTVAGANFQRTISYLEIPIYSRWEIGKKNFKFLILVGPYFGWKLSETTESTNFSHIWNANHPFNHYEKPIRDMHYGIKAGIGFKYTISKHFSIFIDGRYDADIAGSRDIFVDRPWGTDYRIEASRLTEISGSIGLIWNIIPQKIKTEVKGYVPKENMFEDEY